MAAAKSLTAQPMRERLLLLPFLLGFSAIAEVNIAGRLMGTDLLCLAGGAYIVLSRRGDKQWPELRTLIFLAGLWLVAGILSDLYNDSALDDAARGLSRVGVLIAGLIFLGDRARRDINWVTSLWFGLVIALPFKARFVEIWGFSDAPWKFGIGAATMAFLLILLERLRPNSRLRTQAAVAIFSALAVISLFQDARSMFAILALTGALIALRKPIYRIAFSHSRRRSGPIGLMLVIAAGIGLAYSVAVTYENLASSGTLGLAAQRKYQAQANLGVSILQGGRQETLVSFQAIQDSPLLGHGSWARDPLYAQILADFLMRRGAQVSPELLEQELIPSHSFIISAWVDHGILAVPFWIMVILLLVRGVFQALSPQCMHRELVLSLSFSTLWDVFFSPFGAQQRVLVALTCVIICAALHPPEIRPRRLPPAPSRNPASTGHRNQQAVQA